MLRVLSLGAGVQSTTVALMAACGSLPQLDACIFADTGWEPKAVYTHLDWLTGELASHGIPVHRVAKSNIRDDALRSQVPGLKTDGVRCASMPYYVDGDGREGMIKRQCTSEYKIAPIQRMLRTLIGLKSRQRAPRNSFNCGTAECAKRNSVSIFMTSCLPSKTIIKQILVSVS